MSGVQGGAVMPKGPLCRAALCRALLLGKPVALAAKTEGRMLPGNVRTSSRLFYFLPLVCFPFGWKGGPLNPKPLTFRAGHFCCPNPLGQRLVLPGLTPEGKHGGQCPEGRGQPQGSCGSSPMVSVHAQPQTHHTHHRLVHVSVCLLCYQGDRILT